MPNWVRIIGSITSHPLYPRERPRYSMHRRILEWMYMFWGKFSWSCRV